MVHGFLVAWIRNKELDRSFMARFMVSADALDYTFYRLYVAVHSFHRYFELTGVQG